MKQVFYIMFFGSLGAVSRYGIGVAARARFGKAFPYDTLIANVLGCFLIGAVMYGILSRHIDDTIKTALVVGFLGSFTTFSAFGHATFELFQKGEWLLALLNIGANLLVGLFAVWLGMTVARLVS